MPRPSLDIPLHPPLQSTPAYRWIVLLAWCIVAQLAFTVAWGLGWGDQPNPLPGLRSLSRDLPAAAVAAAFSLAVAVLLGWPRWPTRSRLRALALVLAVAWLLGVGWVSGALMGFGILAGALFGYLRQQRG